jgi:hypothetical protein
VSDPVLPIDYGLRRVLRSDPPAPADARARVRARLAAAIPVMSTGVGEADPSRAGAPPAPRVLGLRAVAPWVGVFLAGGVTGAALFAALAGRAQPRVVYVDRPVPAPVVAAPALTAAPLAAPPVVAPEPASPTRPPKGAKSADRTAPPAHVSPFAAERVLLDEARAAIVEGAPDRALDRLAEHRTRFPDGLLAEERDAMTVEALVRAGRYDEARSRAAAFRERTPASLFRATVDAAIASIP